MDAIKLTDAGARLSELVDRVEAGDTIDIVRRGKPVARLTAATDSRHATPGRTRVRPRAIDARRRPLLML